MSEIEEKDKEPGADGSSVESSTDGYYESASADDGNSERGSTHRWRMMAVIITAVAVIVAAVGVMLNGYLSRGVTDPGRVEAGRNVPPRNAQAGPASDEYQRRIAEANAAGSEIAAKTGDSYVPIPGREELLEKEQKKEREAPPPPPPPPPPAAAQQKAVENPYGAFIDAELKQISARMTPGPFKVITFEDRNADQAAVGEPISPAGLDARSALGGSSGRSLAVAYPDGLRTGNVLYAVNDLALNSDSPSPATATIIGGALDGARAIGRFERRGEYLVLGFSRVAMPDGRVFQIDGVAIDADVPQAAIRTAIDKHYLSRWGSFTAASFLSGFADATALAGNSYLTSVGPIGGATVQNSIDYDINDQLWIAGGRVADRAASYLERNLYRPPTVTLKSGTDLGVLILGMKDDQRTQDAMRQQSEPPAARQEAAQQPSPFGLPR